jgi:low affinity Fe/Cu permease
MATGDSKRSANGAKGSVRDAFDRIAGRVTRAVGSPIAVGLAALVILVWAVTGPIFGFSDTWQLAINTGTTIVTFLMVFVIQTTQNRDSEALHLKLDELIRAIQGARDEFITVEQETEEDLARREREMAETVKQVAQKAGHPEAMKAAQRAAEEASRRGQRSASKPREGGGTP